MRRPPRHSAIPREEIDRLLSALDGCMAADRYRLRQRIRGLRDSQRGPDAVREIVERLSAEVARSRARREERAARAPVPSFPPELPVSQKRDEIAAAIREHQVVVVCGETGSGKTTQLPKICLSAGRGIAGLIGHTQPRRIAARAVAARIASELGTSLGQDVGYKVRFSDRAHADGYVKLMTDGILLAETQHDRRLDQYDTIIIDEAHERSLNIDFLLGYLHQLLPRRQDLKVIITSATIDPERFSRHFGGAPIIEVSGRVYPVEVRYRPIPEEGEEGFDRGVEGAIVSAIDELARGGRGDVLVFLSGEREIRDTAEALRKHHVPGKERVEVLPLYARLSAEAQMKVFEPHAGRRIVLATNVAETSLTVPGIRYVVDPGLARISRYSARTRVQRLPIEPISRASADQRKGRCGRVAEGVCIRLYSEQSYQERAEFTDPEILRTNLASVILQMKALHLGSIEQFPFVERPDDRMIRDGIESLHELGAIDERHELTRVGQELGRLPIDPRIGRMILAADREGSLAEVLVIAAALSVQDPRERPHDAQEKADEAHERFTDPQSDFLTLLNLWRFYQEQLRHLSSSKLRKLCAELYVSYMRMREWIDVHRQLLSLCGDMGKHPGREPVGYDEVHRALLAGLLGNVGLKADAFSYAGPRGQRFNLWPGSALFDEKPKWIMAAELVKTSKLYARTVAKIQPQWIEEVGGHLVKRAYTDPHWRADAAQVRAYERVTHGNLEIASGRKVHYGPINPELSRQIFIHHALVEGNFRTRAAFVAHNAAQIEEVRALEAKRRRRDLLVEASAIYEFYDQRVPPNVHSGVQFERWRQWAEREKPDILLMTRADLLQPGKDDFAGGEEYPDSVEMNGVVFKLDYAFEPGGAADGVTLVVPLESAWAIDEARAEWLVPGFLREKVVGMIRALPKDLRVNFVPVPDAAEKALRNIMCDPGSLSAALAEELSRLCGVPFGADVWRPDTLPEYLRMNLRVLSATGEVIVESRDFATVRRTLSDLARAALAKLPVGPLNRGGLTDWDVGDLPERITVNAGPAMIEAFPALTPEGTGVAVRPLASAESARTLHRLGLRRLFAGRLREELRFRPRDIAGFDRMATQFVLMGGKAELERVITELVAERAFLAEQTEIRTRAAFQNQLDVGWNRWTEAEREVAGLLPKVLGEHHALAVKLEGKWPAPFMVVYEDVRNQFMRLCAPGWMLSTPWEWLKQMPRYFAGARARLEKLPTAGMGRDQQFALQVAGFQALYEQRLAAHRAQGIDDPALEKFGWMLQEFRVSLFAQELGTAYPVSPKRLERLWETVRG